MTKFSFNQAVPFEATHVGEVIKDELSARNMKQSELSELTGIQKSILNDVIKGKRSLTPEMALLLENALGISATYLMNIQTQYELDCAKQSERVVLQTKMPFSDAALTSIVLTPAPARMMLSADSSVMPLPCDEFSPLTTVTSILYCFFSPLSFDARKSQPVFPTTSPMKRRFFIQCPFVLLCVQSYYFLLSFLPRFVS